MKKVTIESINVDFNKVVIEFSSSKDISKYFNEMIFKAEYFLDGKEIDLSNVPQGLVVIPLLCNILPVTWVSNAILYVPELDKQFYEAIPEFKRGFIDMYPDCEFQGELQIDRIVENNLKESVSDSAVFFSAGVDAYCTLAQHIDENPDLITVWGSDIPYDNESGWNTLYEVIRTEASKLQLPHIVIKSNFRKVVNESALSMDFRVKLRDSWWHGIQHGIGLIGLASPICYNRGIQNLYIAASYCEETYRKCASDPSIDNYVRFAKTRTIHDSFISRQKKIKIISDKHKEGLPVDLHVCWQNTTGMNCCVCEKCTRTIMGLFAEGELPKEYGFPSDENVYFNCAKLCKYKFEYDDIASPFWKQIQQRAKQNIDLINERDLHKFIYPVFEIDFDKINNSPRRVLRRLCNKVKARIRRLIKIKNL